MKKHLMSGHGKNYLHVNTNGTLIDGEYELIRITTYCGKEFANTTEAQAAGVYKSVEKDNPDNCKTCVRLSRGYAHQRMLRTAAANKVRW